MVAAAASRGNRKGDLTVSEVSSAVPTPRDAKQPHSYADEEHHNLRERVLGGFMWSAIDAGVVQVTQIVGGIVLVRLLTPHDYGLAAMALIFSSLVLMLSDFAMGAALIQRKTITEADRSTVFWFSTAIGVCLTIGGVALSGPLADFYGEPAVQPLFAVVSLTFVLAALQTTPASLMQRDMQYRLIHLRVASAAVVSMIAAITAALLGAGAWALVTGSIAQGLTATVLIWAASSWRPSLTFSMDSLRDLGSYGVNLLGSNVVTYVKNNADSLLVGRFLGAAALGAYGVAFNLMFLPIDRVIFPIQETLSPAFARWQDDLERLAGVWMRALRMLAAALVPAMLGFVVVAPEFVNVVLGKKWSSAEPVFRILAVVALAQCLALLGQRVLAAINRTRFILHFSLIESALSVGAFAIGLQWGIVGVATCYAIVSIPLQVIYVGLTARAVNTTLLSVGRQLLGVALATAPMVVTCLCVQQVLISEHVVAVVRLAVVILTGVVVYVAASWVVNPEAITELQRLRERRRGADAVVVAT